MTGTAMTTICHGWVDTVILFYTAASSIGDSQYRTAEGNKISVTGGHLNSQPIYTLHSFA
jgi:hypothetical protein